MDIHSDTSRDPTMSPIYHPSQNPTPIPSRNATEMPIKAYSSTNEGYTGMPSEMSSNTPSTTPTTYPTISPTSGPTETPISNPTKIPTDTPSRTPTQSPSTYSFKPSMYPTTSPTLTPSASAHSAFPSIQPSENGRPSLVPSEAPTSTGTPTIYHSNSPSISSAPSSLPSLHPSMSREPSMMPSHLPSISPQPTAEESSGPSLSAHPSSLPSITPTATQSKPPSSRPSETPTSNPSSQPSESNNPTIKPTNTPSQIPTGTPSMDPSRSPSSLPSANPSESHEPSINPTERPTGPCFSSFTIATYDSIDKDVATLKESISDDRDRSHFLGGIVRLVAHDFMDFDPSKDRALGSDGCFDKNHASNAGLETIWCDDCKLTQLYKQKYSHILSRADFWVASANSVIRQTSIDNALDMRDTFRWGRRDNASCGGSGKRLPSSAGCGDIEEVFLDRMGLEWKDAVALMGAHTLGRGDRDFSGHHGIWVENDQDAQVFDNQYYMQMSERVWRVRNKDNDDLPQDWTTGKGNNNGRMMLNTDICLEFNIGGSPNCCTRIDKTFEDGQNQCIDSTASKCPIYSPNNSRSAARDAVLEYRDDNDSFYGAFAEAWAKATAAGQSDLSLLTETCENK